MKLTGANRRKYLHLQNKYLFGSAKGGVIPPTPAVGSFVPLSWTGANVVNYDFNITSSTPSTYNKMKRNSNTGDSFDMAIFSNETVNSDDDFVLSQDVETNAQTGWFMGFGLTSETGVNYANIDFQIFVSGLNVYWFEGSTNIALIATLTSGVLQSFRIEYFGGANEAKAYVNNSLVYTATTAYSSDTLSMKFLGQKSTRQVFDHLALKTVQQPDKILVPFGDSITYGRSIMNTTGNSYLFPSVAFTNHNLFVNPVLAISGNTTADLIADQLPLRTRMYDAGRTANVASVMIGINDLRAAVSLATIQTNITTIVSDLQTTGYTVVLQTVLPELDNFLADRLTLNSWIIANSIGADYIVDYTGTDLETDVSLYEADQLHPNALGMTAIAEKLWLTLKDL